MHLRAAIVLFCVLPCCAERSFGISNDAFVKDGTRMLLKAGEMHYSRVPRAYWQDRLRRLRAMGLNAVQT